MIDALIHLVVLLLVLGVVYWAVTTIIGLIPLPAPIGQVVHVLMILILCLIVIYALLPFIGSGFSVVRR